MTLFISIISQIKEKEEPRVYFHWYQVQKQGNESLVFQVGMELSCPWVLGSDGKGPGRGFGHSDLFLDQGSSYTLETWFT